MKRRECGQLTPNEQCDSTPAARLCLPVSSGYPRISDIALYWSASLEKRRADVIRCTKKLSDFASNVLLKKLNRLINCCFRCCLSNG